MEEENILKLVLDKSAINKYKSICGKEGDVKRGFDPVLYPSCFTSGSMFIM